MSEKEGRFPMRKRGYNPDAPAIDLFVDDVQTVDDYLYYKRMSETVGKPLNIIRRPATKPANALVVTREQLQNHQEYLRVKARTEKEGKTLWIEE